MYRYLSVALLVLVAMVFAMGCDEDTSDGDGDGDGDVVLGTITSQTGSLADYGRGWAQAVQLAVSEANAAGGILGGRSVTLITEDDGTDPAIAGTAAQNLVNAGVVGIVGAPASGSSQAAVDITGPAEIPQVSGASTSPELNSANDSSDDHPYFFRTVPADHLQGVVIADLAAGLHNNTDIDLACTNLAILYINNSYGNPFATAIGDRFEDNGGAVAISQGFEEGLLDYGDVVDAVAAVTPDCVAMVAYPTEGGLIVRDWFGGGNAEIPWFGTEGVKSGDFMEEIGETAAGLFYGTAPSNDFGSPEYTGFSAAYTTQFAEEPVIFAHNMYDAAALLVLAIVDADSTTGANVRESLFSVSLNDGGDTGVLPGALVNGIGLLEGGTGIDYNGAGGNVDFLDNGDVISSYEIWAWDGTAEAFETVGSVEGDEIDVD